MLTYSHIVEETFDFKRYNTTSDIQNAISKATFFDSGTNTAEAFRRAKGLFTTAKGARDPARAKREVLILTDGQSDNAANTFAAVESLKRVADVYGLMTGSFSSGGMKELTKYVSAPINEHLFYVQNYQVQGKLVAYIQDSKKALGPKWCATFDI
ncbi:matrilin-3-like [Mercenaria mercenaria]|uniref:matrilin-3-like n=1 Tax=Mercenaria mercenaria TaxID=6596 RepID=UPI00234EF45E|nr:matrilin-3-like [Mercenaria mercenaria]